MRIAVLADVHGNAAALDAVLEDLAALRPDRILLNGDLLAFGPEPVETVTLLRGLDVPSTRGNTDRWLDEVAHERPSASIPEELHGSLRWTIEQLGPGDLRPLTDLPFALAAHPLAAHLYHASAAGDEQGVWPDTPAGEIPALFDAAATPTCVVSHTHLPGERTAGELRVLNTGSVGFPYDGDTRACYLVLEGDPGGPIAATWRRVGYDRERALRAIRERGVPMAARLTARIKSGEF
ncbi:MAG: metallophosphoesterase [Gemmatimonadota bacterium]